MAFRFSLLPRDEQFFVLYGQLAQEIRKAASLLEAMFATDPVDESKVDEIKDAEHRCDALTHDAIQRLHRTFVTPFDREDLYSMSTSLDKPAWMRFPLVSTTILARYQRPDIPPPPPP